MRTTTIPAWLSLAAMMVALPAPANAQESDPMAKKTFTLNPIGHVEKIKGQTALVLREEIEPALLGVDGFSHVWVFWWFSGNDTPKKRSVLRVHPRGNRENPLTGVFACRSPFRPNLIALTLCKVISVKGRRVEIDKIDAFANTPILDLKPYIPGIDAADASMPEWMKRHRKSSGAASTKEKTND